MTVFADLHAHTTQSDGTLELHEVPEVARNAGVAVVALTDHDTIHPGLENPVEMRGGVTLIRGIELRVEVPELGERVDLLGYGVEPSEELTTELDRLQNNRITRANRIINRVEDELNLTLDITVNRNTGRPHIARAIEANENTEYGYEDAFDEVIGNDCPAYVSRTVTDYETGVRLLDDTCAFVSLAHPFRYDNPLDALELLAADLDAIEGPYPYSTHPDGDSGTTPDAVAAVVEEHDLLVTGGTDAHEKTLGTAGLTGKEFGPIADALGL